MDLEIAEFQNWILLRLARAGSDTARNFLNDRRKVERREYDARELWSVCARAEMAQALGVLNDKFIGIVQQAVDEVAKHERMTDSFWQFPTSVEGVAQIGAGDAIPLLRRYVSIEEEWVADIQLQLFVDLVLARLQAPSGESESSAMLGSLIYEYGPLTGKLFQFRHDVAALNTQLVADTAAQRCLRARYRGLVIVVRELWRTMNGMARADAGDAGSVFVVSRDATAAAAKRLDDAAAIASKKLDTLDF